MLYFEDQLHGLDTLHFFDPKWLFTKLGALIQEKVNWNVANDIPFKLIFIYCLHS